MVGVSADILCRARWVPTAMLAAVLIGLSAGCEPDVPPKRRGAPDEPYHLGGSTPDGKSILVVHSNHPEDAWTRDTIAGLHQALRGSGATMDVFYMDTKRKPDDLRMRRAGRLALELIQQTRPDLVIACDDNAQQYVTRDLIGTSMPVVFCGVNADPTKYGLPAGNVTGVLERPHFRQTLQALREIVPVHRLAVLSSYDSTTQADISLLRELAPDLEIVAVRTARTFPEWREAVLDLDGTADALAITIYNTLESDTPGELIHPPAVIDWTRRNCLLPTMGFYDFSVRDGVLISVAESGQEQGRRAGLLALEVLSGRSMDELPMVIGDSGRLMINVRTAELLELAMPPSLLARAERIGEP